MARMVGVSPSTPLDQSSSQRNLCGHHVCMSFHACAAFVFFFFFFCFTCMCLQRACVRSCARWVRCQGLKWRFDIGTVGRRVEKRAGTQTTRATGMEKRRGEERSEEGEI